MSEAYRILKDLITSILPKKTVFIFQQKTEFEDYYGFVLVIEDTELNHQLLKDMHIITLIQNAVNLEISKFIKRVEIEVEVFSESN